VQVVGLKHESRSVDKYRGHVTPYFLCRLLSWGINMLFPPDLTL